MPQSYLELIEALVARSHTKIEPELVDAKSAEIMTGRSRWSWRRDAYAGKIACVKIGKRLLIPMAEIRRVIAENTRPRAQNEK